MSARIEAAAKAIDAVEYEPGDNAMAARMATDPALYAFRVAQARAAVEAADAVSLANGAEVDLMQLTSCCLLGSQAAAALAALSAEVERLRANLEEAAGNLMEAGKCFGEPSVKSLCYAASERARAALRPDSGKKNPHAP